MTCVPALPIDTSRIQSATLKLTLAGTTPASSRSYDLYRIGTTCSNGHTCDWSESATWANQPDSLATTPTASATTPVSTTATMSWNVKSDVIAFLAASVTNNGWLLKDRTEGSGNGNLVATFHSRDCTSCTDAQKPYVEVVFAP
jgi:hypothetical protein